MEGAVLFPDDTAARPVQQHQLLRQRLLRRPRRRSGLLSHSDSARPPSCRRRWPASVDGYKTAARQATRISSILHENISAGYADEHRWTSLTVFICRPASASSPPRWTRTDSTSFSIRRGARRARRALGCGVPDAGWSYSSCCMDVLAERAAAVRHHRRLESAHRPLYSRGLSRPDAYQLVPYATEDDSTNPATVAIGNPALKPSHANNYSMVLATSSS